MTHGRGVARGRRNWGGGPGSGDLTPRVGPSLGRGARSLREVTERRSLAPRERERSERSGERWRPHPADSLAGAPAGRRSLASSRDGLVGAAGIEPATTCSQSVPSNTGPPRIRPDARKFEPPEPSGVIRSRRLSQIRTRFELRKTLPNHV